MAPELKVRNGGDKILACLDFKATKKDVLRLRRLQGECLGLPGRYFIWARNSKNKEIRVAIELLDLSESSIRILNWEYDIEWEEK